MADKDYTESQREYWLESGAYSADSLSSWEPSKPSYPADSRTPSEIASDENPSRS